MRNERCFHLLKWLLRSVWFAVVISPPFPPFPSPSPLLPPPGWVLHSIWLQMGGWRRMATLMSDSRGENPGREDPEAVAGCWDAWEHPCPPGHPHTDPPLQESSNKIPKKKREESQRISKNPVAVLLETPGDTWRHLERGVKLGECRKNPAGIHRSSRP